MTSISRGAGGSLSGWASAVAFGPRVRLIAEHLCLELRVGGDGDNHISLIIALYILYVSRNLCERYPDLYPLSSMTLLPSRRRVNWRVKRS
jgi:hypothetical protein